MFGIGWQEILVIFVVLLIFFGPRKLPELARAIGKVLRDLSRAKEEVRRTIEDELLKYEDERNSGDNREPEPEKET